MLYRFCKKWSYAFILAGVMLAFQYATIFGIIVLTPPDHSWLGATITNASDTGVYINYINQASESLLLKNFYAEADHIARFDPFWTVGGLFVRMGATPILAHEILRILTTIILAFAIFATAKSVTKNPRDARLTSLLMLFGLSTGWIYSVYMSITNSWAVDSLVPSDLSNEFALIPILLGGAHMILSPALLMLNTRWLWQIITQNRKPTAIPWLTIACHVSFHPYYIPIYGLISLLAFAYTKTKKSLLRFLVLNSAMLPGAIYYLYLIFKDNKLREHHLITNTLPLDPFWMWLIMLLPIIIAYIWILWNKANLDLSGKTWVWIWLLSAIICMFLPLPWNRKFQQALLPALVILTLPLWLFIYHSLKPKTDFVLKAAFIILLAFPFLHLMQSQLALATDPAWNKYFYVSNATITAWDKLKAAPSDSLTISTSLYTCLWTPANTKKRVWIGHNHETPNFLSRFADYQAWRRTTSTNDFNNFLDDNGITHVITDKNRYTDLFNNNWQVDYNKQNISLWSRKN
ncbi:hypothetical protein GF391_04420 [Candidatus Uhrbacteria bacterium]|nr:hypothetical protein [Candidatus Uhrbacteria bacterium]